MSSNKDRARELADKFKRDGQLDRLKEDILSRRLTDDQESTVVQIIRKNVSAIVKNMILEDENLLFKNRGSTSALLESQLLKDGYKSLVEKGGCMNVEEYVETTLNDPQLLRQIKESLQRFLHDEKDE